MARRPKKKPWWEEPPSPRKPNRDEIEDAEVKAVIAELPAQCEAAKAYQAGVDTVPHSPTAEGSPGLATAFAQSDGRGTLATLGTDETHAFFMWRVLMANHGNGLQVCYEEPYGMALRRYHSSSP